MLVYLFECLLARWPDFAALHALEKTTARASLAAVTSFALVLLFGPLWIRWLRSRFREPIKSDSAEIMRLHQAKQFTPTMGGLFVVGALLASAIVVGDWRNPFFPIAILTTVALAALGACDDVVKLTTAASGLRARTKLLAQLAIALVVSLLVYRIHASGDARLEMAVPFVDYRFTLGWMFIPLAMLVIVGASNAVNLTDGLDGLAGGCLLSATAAMALVVYAAGHVVWTEYLSIPHVRGASEMSVIAAAMIGGLLGFLWFNCHPASVFMGDTGSLPLGGLLGLLAVIARQELLLVAIGGVFVVEALSVILQVGVFRWKRRRVLKCAPLHHHFQLLGWPEDKIVVRFWIAAMLCAIIGMAGLKSFSNETIDSGREPQLTQNWRDVPNLVPQGTVRSMAWTVPLGPTLTRRGSEGNSVLDPRLRVELVSGHE